MGRALGADERAGARERDRLDPRFALRAADAARRAALLRARCRADRATELRHVQARRRDRAEPVRGLRRRDRAPADALAGEGRRRGARRLARLDAPLRLAARAAARARSATRSPASPFATPTRTAPSRASPPRCSAPRGASPPRVFTTYSDLGAFSEPVVPVPDEPRVIFVGVLERYKNVEVLAAAWRIVARARSRARSCTWSASGTQAEVAEGLAREGVEWERRLEPPALAAAVDRARALLLPVRLRGAAAGRDRVVPARPRGVGSRAGGIPDIVQDGVNGLLVEPGDAASLAAAIERILTDHDLAVRLGAAAAESSADVGLLAGRVRGSRSRPRRRGARGDEPSARAADGRADALPAPAEARAPSGSSRRSGSASTCACSRPPPTGGRTTTASSSSSGGRRSPTGRSSTCGCRSASGGSPAASGRPRS